MAKVKQEAPVPSYGYAYVVAHHTPDRLVGQILTIVEALGLTDKQEESVKGLIRAAIWDIVGNDGIYITDVRHKEIREAWYEMKRKADIDQTPPRAI